MCGKNKVGSLNYVPPEFFHETARLGPPRDLFSLGIVLVELALRQDFWDDFTSGIIQRLVDIRKDRGMNYKAKLKKNLTNKIFGYLARCDFSKFRCQNAKNRTKIMFFTQISSKFQFFFYRKYFRFRLLAMQEIFTAHWKTVFDTIGKVIFISHMISN